MEPWNKEQIRAQQKAANKRERQIAGAYFQEAPIPSNLYNAFIHWYNSIPFYDKYVSKKNVYELPKFEGGKEPIDGGTPFGVVVTGRDRRPAWKRMYQNPRLGDTSQYYNGDAIRNITDWAPGIGDVSQGFDAYHAAKNGNYGEAAMLGGLLFLPNIVEKPLKKTLTIAEKLSRAAKIQNAKSIAIRRANAAARKAAEDQKYYESFGPTREGRSIVQPVSDKVPYRYRYPDGTYERNFELSPTLQVRNTTQNYVANEAERAAAIDFLRENPGMRGAIGTTVSKDYYNPYDYTYPRTQYFNDLLQPRKTSKQVSTELDKLLRTIR